jgi:hypothetical protein
VRMRYLDCDFNHNLSYRVTMENVVYVPGCESQDKRHVHNKAFLPQD